MQIFKIILLGIVQGLTEFLPVSSSGHILLMQRLLGVPADTVVLTLVLHLGTLVAVLAVFFKDFLSLFRPPFKNLGLLVLASVPAAVAGLLLDGKIDVVFGGKFLGFAFLFTAALLFISDKLMKKKHNGQIGLKQAAVMGVMQAVALVPGVSRSGSTIFGGLVTKANKDEATSFAFLMSVPVILGACLVKFIGNANFETADLLPLLAGFVSSALAGILAIKVVLKLIKKNNFLPFCIYLIVISVVSFVVM